MIDRWAVDFKHNKIIQTDGFPLIEKCPDGEFVLYEDVKDYFNDTKIIGIPFQNRKAFHVSELSSEQMDAIRNAKVPPENEYLDDELNLVDGLNGTKNDNEALQHLEGIRLLLDRKYQTDAYSISLGIIENALQPKTVNVDLLKQETRIYLGHGNVGEDDRAIGWNDCIDHLSAQGYLTPPTQVWSDGQWQPIETAPKDGSWLIGTKGNDPETGNPYLPVIMFWKDAWVIDSRCKYEPTYWMPLPADPKPDAIKKVGE